MNILMTSLLDRFLRDEDKKWKAGFSERRIWHAPMEKKEDLRFPLKAKNDGFLKKTEIEDLDSP